MKRTLLKRKSAIKSRSKKKAKNDEVRKEVLVQLVIERGPYCEARRPGVCQGHCSDGHEILTRGRGGDPADPNNIILVCRKCHDWIHANPLRAVALGLMKNSWDA